MRKALVGVAKVFTVVGILGAIGLIQSSGKVTLAEKTIAVHSAMLNKGTFATRRVELPDGGYMKLEANDGGKSSLSLVRYDSEGVPQVYFVDGGIGRLDGKVDEAGRYVSERDEHGTDNFYPSKREISVKEADEHRRLIDASYESIVRGR